jgi:hypothetical protein
MKFTNSIWFFLLTFYILPIVLFFLITIGVLTYMNLIPANQTETLIGAFIAAASILFGFTSSSIIRFSNKIMDIKRRSSDIAKELCELSKQIEDDSELSSKNLAYITKIHSWGRDSGFGANGTAPYTIKQAYDFLIWTFRWWIDMFAKIIYFVQGLALVTLGVSIFCGLLSYASVLAETTIFITVLTFIISMPILGFGWLISQKLLTQLDDTIFVVRHQIHGGLKDILPHAFQPR